MDRLRKSSTDKVFFGVGGGIGRYFQIDPVLVRAGLVVLVFAGGLGILLYIILAIIMPEDTPEAAAAAEGDTPPHVGRRREGLAALLIVVGAVILLANLGAFGWFRWDLFWPLLLIGLGAAIILQRYRRPS